MTTLALVTRARKVTQARWEQARRVKEMAIAASNRYQALLYEYYAEEIHLDDEVQPPPVAGALGAGGN